MTGIQTGDTLGQYEIVSRLGAGGMATVYAARQTSLGRMVALKVLTPSLSSDEEFVRRFELEAKTVARLDHPNIVSVFDAGQSGGHLFLAMRLINGPTLAELLQQGGPMPTERVIGLLTQIAAAIDYAHGSSVIHRDIKPGNILVEPDDRASLADFGIARDTSRSQRTRAGVLAGTPEYLAPEVIRGRPASAASDLYALGVVAFQMLAGRVPFASDNEMTVLFRHVNEEPVSLATLRPDLPAHVCQAVRVMLAKDPSVRLRTGAAFAEALSGLGPILELGGGGGATEATGNVADHPAVPIASVLSGDATTASRWRRFLPVLASAGVMFAVAVAVVLASSSKPGAPTVPSRGTVSVTPGVDVRWRQAKAELNAAWAKDWPGALRVTKAFHDSAPEHSEGRDQLYLVLVVYGMTVNEAGDTTKAEELWRQAAKLLPGRTEAGDLIAGKSIILPPTSTPGPEPSPTTAPEPTEARPMVVTLTVGPSPTRRPTPTPISEEAAIADEEASAGISQLNADATALKGSQLAAASLATVQEDSNRRSKTATAQAGAGIRQSNADATALQGAQFTKTRLASQAQSATVEASKRVAEQRTATALAASQKATAQSAAQNASALAASQAQQQRNANAAAAASRQTEEARAASTPTSAPPPRPSETPVPPPTPRPQATPTTAVGVPNPRKPDQDFVGTLGATVKFEWDKTDGARSYRLYIRRMEGSQSAPESYETTSNEYVLPVSAIGQYQWEVRAVGAQGQEGDPAKWSRRFAVVAAQPTATARPVATPTVVLGVPVLLSPGAAITIIAGSMVSFSWNQVPNANSYVLVINGGSGADSFPTPNTSIRITFNPGSFGVYRWEVRAIGFNGIEGGASSQRSITVNRS